MKSNLQNILPKIENISMTKDKIVVSLGFSDSLLTKIPWFKNKQFLNRVVFRTIICGDPKVSEQLRLAIQNPNIKNKYFTSEKHPQNPLVLVADHQGQELFTLLGVKDVTVMNQKHYLKKEIQFDNILTNENIDVFSGFYILDNDSDKSLYLFANESFISNGRMVNSKIKDLSIFEEINKLKFDFKSVQEDLLKSSTTKLVKNLSLEQNSSCFSELMFNRNGPKSYQVLFWMDILELFKKNSQFPKLLEKKQFSKFFIDNGYGKVKDVALFRQKGNKNNYDVNSLSTNLNKKIISENYPRELVFDAKDLSTVKIVSLDDRSPWKKLFVISDSTFSDVKDGDYTYTLELSLEDSSIFLLEEIIQKLKDNLVHMQTLEQVIEHYDLHDHSGDFFKPKFFIEADKIGKGILKQIVSDLFYTVNQLSDTNISVIYSSLLSNKENFDLFVFDQLKKSYNNVISQLELAIGKIDKSSQLSSGNMKTTIKNILIVHNFKENISSIANKDYFLEFVDYKQSYLPFITKANLGLRFDEEFSKFYSTTKTKNIDRNYITPKKMVYGKNMIENNLSSINTINYRKYLEFMVEYIQIKDGKIVKPEIYDSLLNILKDFNFDVSKILNDNKDGVEVMLLDFVKSYLFNETGLTTLSQFDGNYRNNILDEIKDRKLPVQIRSAVDSFTKNGITKSNFEFEPFKEIQNMFGLLFTYKVLGHIKIADGFQKNSTNINWVDLDDQNINSAKTMLCKLDYYLDTKLGVPENQILHNLEIFGRYFILQ